MIVLHDKRPNLMRAFRWLTLVLAILCLCAGVASDGATHGNSAAIIQDSVKVGVVLPAKGPLAETAAAMRDVLNAYFTSINGSGGIHGRRVELHFAESGDDAVTTTTNVKRLIHQERLFAMVSGITAGADYEIAALAREEKIPIVGPATLLPPDEPFNRYIFCLLPGIREQARALVTFAARDAARKNSIVAVVYSESQLTAIAATAVENQAKKSGWSRVVKYDFKSQGFDASQLVKTLKQNGVGDVFFLGASGEDVVFLKEAIAANWIPNLFLIGVFSGRDLPSAATAPFKEKVFLSFPTVPSDISASGQAEFLALLEKYKVARRHLASQLHGLAAAKVLVEGLKRAGKDPDREKLILALESLDAYDSGVIPKLTFGPARRVGARGAYIVGLDPVKGQFSPEREWISVD
jgi:ABC-type branched-subunit amino acid transport system substrate-binding protein